MRMKTQFPAIHGLHKAKRTFLDFLYFVSVFR